MKKDLRKYAKNTTVRLAVGFLIILLFIGAGLIYWTYGPGAAIMGVLCILGGLLPIGLIALVLGLLDLVVKKANDA